MDVKVLSNLECCQLVLEAELGEIHKDIGITDNMMAKYGRDAFHGAAAQLHALRTEKEAQLTEIVHQIGLCRSSILQSKELLIGLQSHVSSRRALLQRS